MGLLLPLFFHMINISESKWQDIKHNWLAKTDADREIVPLVEYEASTNRPINIGEREIYEFTHGGKEIKMMLDKEFAPTGGEKTKHGTSFDRDPHRFIYKLRVQFRDQHGKWVDASALEDNFED